MKKDIFLNLVKYYSSDDLLQKQQGHLIEKIKNDYPEILESINSTGKLEDEIKSKLIEVIDNQKKGNK